MVILGQKWLYSGKNGYIWTKVIVFGKKIVLFGKTGCIREKVVVFMHAGFILRKNG